MISRTISIGLFMHKIFCLPIEFLIVYRHGVELLHDLKLYTFDGFE